MGQDQGKLSKTDVKSLCEKTKFSGNQVKDFFRRFEADYPSGLLTKEAFADVYSQMYRQGDTSRFCELAFRTFDKDNNGTLDFSEFLIAIDIMTNGTSDQKLEWIYKMCDADEDGQVTKEEMTNLITATAYMMKYHRYDEVTDEVIEEKVADMFKCLDTNKDGVISKEEFMSGCKTNPGIMNLLART